MLSKPKVLLSFVLSLICFIPGFLEIQNASEPSGVERTWKLFTSGLEYLKPKKYSQNSYMKVLSVLRSLGSQLMGFLARWAPFYKPV